MYKNQQISENVNKLYLDSETADVHFTVNSAAGDGVSRIGAHKSLLGSGSDVFKAMLYGELKETGDVNIVDVSDAAFKEFLQYFYLTDVKLTHENIAGVIRLGDKYNVKKCVEDSIEFLMGSLDAENVCAALHIAMLYDRPELMKACETFIVVNTGTVFESIGFLECDKVVLAHILTTINVFSCSEVEVFEACMAWVHAKCKQKSLTKALVKKHLGDLYYEIRFASMTMEDLLNLVEKYDAVLGSDFRQLSQVIVKPEAATERFNTQKRQAIWNSGEIITCDRTLFVKSKWYKASIQIETKFTTTKPLMLGSFVCSEVVYFHTEKYNLRADLLVDVELTEATNSKGENSRTLLKLRAELQSQGTKVSLPHPVLIRPGYFYTISIGQFPDAHRFLSKGMTAEILLESDMVIKFHNFSHDSDSKNPIGLVSVLNFNKISLTK